MIRLFALLLIPGWLLAAQYAVLVGSENGGAGVVPLRYVKSDLVAMRQVLIDHCGYSPEKIVTIRDGSPEQLTAQLRSIRSRLRRDDQFFFYYTGHADNRSLRMGKRRFDLVSLKSHLDSLEGSLQIVVLDACQSGSFGRLKGGTIDEPLILRNESGDGRVVLFSSSESEFSQESDYLKHSIFSYYFMNGLRGMADISGDQKVTVDEAYRYAYGQTVAATVNSAGGVQHPGFLFDYQGKGDILLSDMTSKTAGVTLDRSVMGQIVIIDPSKQIVADFRADGSREMIVSLNPGKYTIFRNHNGKAAKKTITVGSSRTVIRANSFVATGSIPVIRKGGAPQTVVSLGGSGGTSFIDHSKLERSLTTSSAFPPEIPFLLEFTRPPFSLGGGFSVQSPRGVVTSAQIALTRYYAENETAGSRIGPVQDTYRSLLIHNDLLKYTEIRTLVGYRFSPANRFAFSILGGGSFLKSRFQSDVTYNDSLFSTSRQISKEFVQNSVLFCTAANSELSLSPAFSVMVQGVYGKEISHKSTAGDVAFDPSGLRLELTFLFHLNGE